MLQFVLIQLLNQAGLCFPAEYDRNNNPKLARILHFCCSTSPGALMRPGSGEKSYDLNLSD